MALNMDAAFRIVTTTAGTEKLAALGRGLKGAETNATGANRAFQALGGMGRNLGNVLRQIAPALTVGGLIAIGKNALDSADALGKMSTRTGVLGSQLDKFRQAADLSDTSLDTVEKGLLRLGQSMTQAENPTSKQAKAFDQLGVSFKNADGTLRPLNDVFLDVATKFKDMPDGVDKSRIAMDLFGRSAGPELIPMLNMGGDAIDGFTSRFSDQFIEDAQAFNDRLTRIKESIGTFAMAIAGEGIPAIDKLANEIEWLTKKFDEMDDETKALIGQLVVLGAGAAVLAGAIGLIALAVGKVVAGLKVFVAAITGIKLGAVIAGWAGAVGPFVTAMTIGIGKVVAVVKGAGVILAAIFSGPAGWIALAVIAVIAMAIAFREPLMEFVQWLWDWGEPIREFWIGLWEGLKEGVTRFIDWLKNAFSTGISEPIKAALDGVVEFFQDTWGKIRQSAQDLFSWFINAINEYLVQPIANALAPILEQFKRVWEGVKSFLIGWFSWWGQFFYKMFIEPIDVALRALSAMFDAAFRAVREAINRALDGIAQFFTNQVVQPMQQAWQQFTTSLGQLVQAASQQVQSAWSLLSAGFNRIVVEPIRAAWEALLDGMRNLLQNVVEGWKQIWGSITDAFKTVGESFRTNVVEPIQRAWSGIVDFMRGVVQNAAGALQSAWQAIAGGIVGAFQSVVNTVGRVVNQIISAINTLINGINQVRAAAGLSSINLIPQWNIPSFGDGGVVSRPTLALVGERNEREYIIPESKMARAAENYLSGQRGDAVLAAQRFQMPMTAGNSGVTVTPGRSPINITTGPVQQIDGRQYATIEDLEKVAREVATQIYSTLRTPAGRRAIGVS
jgi:phage-related protein